MTVFNYQLTYAGVPFCLDTAAVARMHQRQDVVSPDGKAPPQKHQPEVDLLDELNRLIPFSHGHGTGKLPNYPGRKLGSLARREISEFDQTEIKIGDWYYPPTASRWSVFRGLATSSMVKVMLAATEGSEPADFVMKCAPVSPDNPQGDPDNYTLTSSMYMLPARPLAEHGGQYDGLYLVTLVDERYYWNYTSVTLRVTRGTTWPMLIDQLANTLDIVLNYSLVSSNYAYPEPDSQLWVNLEDANTLLDAIAFNLGRIVVRNLDGRYDLLTYGESQDLVISNRRGTENQVVRAAGGNIFGSGLKTGNLNPSKNAAIPETVTVAFPKYVLADPIPHYMNTRYPGARASVWHEDSYGEEYFVDVPLSSGGPVVSGLLGVAGFSHTIHSTAKALIQFESSTFPDNQSGLNCLAMQVAEDYLGYQVGSALDEVYPGTFAWDPEGFHDIIWTYSAKARQASTRVSKTIWNQVVTEMQHGFRPITGGVGGRSVAQTMRDGDFTATSYGLVNPLFSGDPSALLTTADGLPTDNRWKGLVNNEAILFEAANGPTVTIVYRGIDGTDIADHAALSPVQPLKPNTTYGVNLTTYGDSQFAFPAEQSSGGIQGLKVVPQTQTVRLSEAGGVDVGGLRFYQANVRLFDYINNSFQGTQAIWAVERNNKNVLPNKDYGGMFAGYSFGLPLHQPVYLMNEDKDQTSGTVVNYYNTTFNITSGSTLNIINNSFVNITNSFLTINNATFITNNITNIYNGIPSLIDVVTDVCPVYGSGAMSGCITSLVLEKQRLAIYLGATPSPVFCVDPGLCCDEPPPCIVTDCCGDVCLPLQLCLTLSSDCPCITTDPIILIYNGDSAWLGTSDCDGTLITWAFGCVEIEGTLGYKLIMACSGSNQEEDVTEDFTCSADCFEASGELIDIPGDNLCCPDTTISWRIGPCTPCNTTCLKATELALGETWTGNLNAGDTWLSWPAATGACHITVVVNTPSAPNPIGNAIACTGQCLLDFCINSVNFFDSGCYNLTVPFGADGIIIQLSQDPSHPLNVSITVDVGGC